MTASPAIHHTHSAVEDSAPLDQPQLSSIYINKDDEAAYSPQGSLSEQERIQVCLEFHDIHFGVKQSKGLFSRKSEDKEILKGVSGIVKPGQMLAIMGASGAGKSTLLNVLAGRMSSSGNYFASGSVRLNGQKREFSVFKKVRLEGNIIGEKMTVSRLVHMSCKMIICLQSLPWKNKLHYLVF